MSKTEVERKMVEVLNEAFAADPKAIEALVEFRVPCNDKLADHPHVVVQDNMIAPGNSISMIGLLNGILSGAGLQKIASNWELSNDDNVAPKLIGFTAFKPAQ